jgi:D-glycero-D-manno-heptose 1,7-bisphosphate phosphatase
MTSRAVILDRDATLIDVVRDEETGTTSVAFHPDQLRLLPGVVAGLQRLSAAGYLLAVATNQPGPAKGQFTRSAVERTNSALVTLLQEHGIELAAFEVCLHHPEGGLGGDPELVMACECRKPKPGMLQRIVARLGVDPSQSWMIGDSPGDVSAAIAAGLRTALVFPTQRCELCPLRAGVHPEPEVRAARFDAAAAEILRRSDR